MENRKTKLSKILTHFDSLVDEKRILVENLELLVNQLNPYVDHAKKNEIERRKDMNNILKYELKVLKKLTELNSDLECFLDYKTELNYETFEPCEVELKPRTSTVQHELPISKPESNEFSTEMDESSMTIIPFEFNELQSENVLPEIDIQNLRNCLENFSAKLGLNQQSFSNMEDYYDKPTSSCTREAQIDQPQINISKVTSNTSEKVDVSEGYEIPVRDTFISLNSSQSNAENIDGDEPGTDKMCSEIPNNSFLKSDLKRENLVAENFLCSPDGINTNIASEILNSYEAESISVENSLCSPDGINTNIASKISNSDEAKCISRKESQKEIIDQVHKSQTDLHSTVKQSASKCDISGRNKDHNTSCPTLKSEKNYSTALMKLNSYRSKKLNDAILETDQLPDISLKPIKTNHSSGSMKSNSKNSSHSKKHRKRENAENGTAIYNESAKAKKDTFYELVRKKAPKIGDKCAISHIESPSEFYIHIDDEETALIDSLTEQINEYFNGTVSTYNNKHMAYSDMGNFCFSYIPDYLGWYRVEVLDWYLDYDIEEILVQLVDYGNIRKTSYKNLRKMIKEIGEIPILAIRCHFPLMFPYGSTLTNKLTEWPEVAVEALLDLTANNGMQNLFKIVYAEGDSHSVAIDLLSSLEEKEENTLGQILLDLGIAVQIIHDQPSM